MTTHKTATRKSAAKAAPKEQKPAPVEANPAKTKPESKPEPKTLIGALTTGTTLLSMDVTKWDAAEWAAFGAVGAVVVYVVLGITALRQLGESRRLRELEHRPYVLVDWHFKGIFVALEVRNIGRTPARNVEVSFDKPLQAPSSARNPNFSIFQAPVPMVAPGRVIRLPMGRSSDFFRDGAGVPLSYTVRAKYTDMTGKQPYDDPPLLLDIEPYKYTTAPRDNASDLVDAVREVRNTLNKWNSHNGLKVSSTDRLRYDRREYRWDHFYEAQRMIREGGVKRLWKFEKERVKRRLG